MKVVGKYALAGLLVIIGLSLSIYGKFTGQTTGFTLSSLGIFLAGIVTVLLISNVINRTVSYIIGGVFMVGSIFVAVTTVDVIQGPMKFKAERDMRYSHVKQRMKDIRKAQLVYKDVYGQYTHSFDSLLHFVKHDSVPFLISHGETPDGMTRQMAIDSGYVVIEEILIPAIDTTFSSSYLANENYVGAFHLDSLPFIPFTNKKFRMEASKVDKNGVLVPVFQLTDVAPFDSTLTLMLGSLTDPSTSGNWD